MTRPQSNNNANREFPLRKAHAIAAVGLLAILGSILILTHFLGPLRSQASLLHVSFDASRELFEKINIAYAETAQAEHAPEIRMSHAGSIRQARNLAQGLQADIVSLASAYDAAQIKGLTHQPAAPIAPFHSTVSFIVRKGNPKSISEWEDLFRTDVQTALPNPNESGIGRWAYLSMYSYLNTRYKGNTQSISYELNKLIERCELIDHGSRDALDVFKNQSRSDVLLTWESEALSITNSNGEDLQAIFPSQGIRIDLFIVRAETAHQGADDYLAFLSNSSSQQIALDCGFRPSDTSLHLPDRYPKNKLLTLENMFPDPDALWETLFKEEGTLEKSLELRKMRTGLVP